MKIGEPKKLLRNVLLALIVVLAIGFLGLGIRVSATVVNTHLAFLAVCAISIAILVFYLVLRRRTRRRNAYSALREPPFVKRPLMPRPDTR
jgi:heme A synthase